MSNKTYDILKDIALYVMPALATLILTLGSIWGIPYAEAIAATITALDTFLGAVLKISSKVYEVEGKQTALYYRKKALENDKIEHAREPED